MVIEWLKFRVSPTLRQQFLEADRAIWTAAFTPYPGFLGKQVWAPPDQPEIVIIVVQWQSRELWRAFPGDRLTKLNHQFDAEMGATNYELLEIGDYDVLT